MSKSIEYSNLPPLHLYSVTLQKPTSIVKSILGNFSGTSTQEIVIARGSYLELYQTDKDTEKLELQHSYNFFAIIRAIAPFRIAGSKQDHIIVTSDSGRIAIVDYNAQTKRFEQIHLETYGKTGVRRVVPGQYLTVDPKGRAALIASVEKNKLVYVLNRDSQANVTISSPLEAHTSRTIVYDVMSVDVGYENPLFAALEIDYSELELSPEESIEDQIVKKLTYYELDLGLNHVVRKWTTPVDRHANLMLQVPGSSGDLILPSGVLVATNNYISYFHMDKPELRIPIPLRDTVDPTTAPPTCIVTGVVHNIRGMFFFLVQNELGDLFKISIAHEDGDVQSISIQYFDTIPVAISLNILKSGLLFAASESGNHILYRFLTLGDEDDVEVFTSDQFPDIDSIYRIPHTFTPRALTNLTYVDKILGLQPLTGSQVVNLDATQDIPQIYTIGGQGVSAAFKTLIYGIGVSEFAASELPDSPIGVWTTKVTDSDKYDKYIVFSFPNKTLVLSVGENIEDVSDSGFLLDVSTLFVQQLGQDSLLQIHENGIRHIKPRAEGTEEGDNINEWDPPKGTRIIAACANNFQVAIALTNNTIIYFELDDEGNLNEYEEPQELPSAPLVMSIGKVPEGKVRSFFLAVGCEDSTIRIFSLDLESTLDPLAIAALTAPPSDILIMSMVDGLSSPNDAFQSTALYLHVGLTNGVYVVAQIDSLTGQLSSTRKRFLGPKEIKLATVVAKSQESVLAMSTTSWLGYMNGVNFEMNPIIYSPLSFAAGLNNEVVEDGIVATHGNVLRIFSLENVGQKLLEKPIQLELQPRKFTRNSFSPFFYVAESQYNTKLASKPSASITNGEKTEEENGPKKPEYDPKLLGHPRKAQSWASVIQVVDPISQTILDTVRLQDNESAISITSCYFESHDKEYLCVGVVRNFNPEQPKGNPHAENAIYVYDYAKDPRESKKGNNNTAPINGKKLKLLHKTTVNEIPSVMIEFQGRLLVGMGPYLSIFDLGIKQLLRKAEAKLNITTITALDTQGSRIVVGDNRESVTFVVYKPVPNLLIPFADDVIPRHVTTLRMLDYDTCMCGDKFGNVFVMRCPDAVSKASDEDEYGGFILNQKPYLGGAANKLEMVAHFYLSDIVTGISRASLAIGGRESAVLSGIQGSLTGLIPFVSRRDGEFMMTLEKLMRTHAPPLSGRHHLIYRGYYAPVKWVVDGDLCEQFPLLPVSIQEVIAKELERSVKDICKKIDDMRVASVF